MRARDAWLVAIVLTVLGVAGCSSEPGPPDPSTLPAGAISLIQNQPNSPTIEGRSLIIVASSIDESGARLNIGDPQGDKPATAGWVDLDGTTQFDGTTLRLVATWVDPDPGEGDGGSRSKAWVVAE